MSTAPAPGVAKETSKHPRPGKGFLINRNFRLLAIGQAISNMGDFVYSTTLLIWVFVLTHSAAAVSGVLIAQYLPVFLLGPIAGVFVDRWNRRLTMVVSDVTRAIIALLPLLVPLFLRLPTIYASVFLISAFSRFFMPARSGMLQVIVADEQQPQAASISQATFALSFIIGPAIASPLFFAVGPVVACIIDAVSFLISAISVQAIRASKEDLHPYHKPEIEYASGGIKAVIHELFAGLKFVVQTRALLIVVILILIAMLGGGALNALDIIFVNQRLHVSTSLYGPLVAMGGLGTLLGAVGAGLLSKKVMPRHILAGGVFLLGVGLMIYAFQTQYILAIIVMFITGIPQGGIDVGFTPILLGTTPRSLIGRVESVIETTMYGVSLISIALAGYFGQFIPVYIIYAIGGAFIALAGLFGWFALPKETYTSQKTK
ncbi:MAG TPA: MFS transporter [Ktedonobacteraceae bacterium]|nr:MFS transporter [Ktedonobacteraceae bacterium]